MSDKSEIGRRIKEALKRAHVTQRKLSKALEISESNVTSYIQGSTQPSAQGFAIIAKLTGVSLDWLLTGQESNAKEPCESYQVTQIHRTLSPEEEKVLLILKEDPDAAAMWKMLLSMPEAERRDAAEVWEMYHHLPRSQRMRRKADILEDIEKLEKEKGGGTE